MHELNESLRQVMRHWTTGVSVVTSAFEGAQHGMTVNSFASVSLEPPIISLSLAHSTRTYALAMHSGILAVTILSDSQREISDRFAGRGAEQENRFVGLETFKMVSGAPLLAGGIGYVDGRIISTHPLPQSTLFLVEVLAAQTTQVAHPLVYFNRGYHRISHDI